MKAHLDIAAVGMVTAVGLDAASSCAAMRARLDGFQATDFIGSDGEGMTGAPIPLPRKWIGEKKLAHIAAAAIKEAFDAEPEIQHQTAFVFCLPERGRPGSPVKDASALVRRIGTILEIDLSKSARIIEHGRPSGHLALDHARRVLASGEARFVMIVGVDSYLTNRSIDHYRNTSRLLQPDNPNGFIPGEAAAAILCRPAAAGGFGLFGLGLSREPAPIYNVDDIALRGEGMAAAYRAALAGTGLDLGNVGYRISDFIGEQYWFKQSALAVLKTQRIRNEFQDVWSAGESLGNIGAAAGPIMLAMAFIAAQKGYAAGNPVLLESSGDDGACGAALLGKASR